MTTEKHTTYPPGGLVTHQRYVCLECGVTVEVGEYHPNAACLMVMGCRDSATIHEALIGVFEDGVRAAANKCRCSGEENLAAKIEDMLRCDHD